MHYRPHSQTSNATTALLLLAILLMCNLGARCAKNLCMEFELVRDACSEVSFYCDVIISQWLVGLTEYDKLSYFTWYNVIMMFFYVLFKN